MPRYTIRLTVDAGRIDALKAKILKVFPDCASQVEKIKSDMSRADRLSEAESSLGDAKSVVEELKDEIQNWHDSLPENLQNGEKASQLEECADALEEIYNDLESAEGNFGSVDFPSMY